MKHLNNQQLILLAVLVSFVTSTATGIFTVALLADAPEGVTNTINRVVERTVQVVTQPAVERVIEKKQETVIEQGSQIVQDVVKNGAPTIVTLAVKKNEVENNEASATENIFVRKGIGVIIGATGKILTFSSIIDEKTPYYLVDESGTTTVLVPLSLEKNSADVNLAEFKTTSPKSETYQAMAIAKKTPAIGQTAVVWGSQGVSVSFVSSVQAGKAGSTYRVYTDSADPLPGRIVSDVDGNLMGLLRADNTLIPASAISAFLASDAKAGV